MVRRALSSLTNRIFLACTLLATISLGVAIYFVNARVSAEAEAELARGLTEAATLVDQHRALLTDTFTRIASVVADLPKLKAAVATDDPPTVQPLADDYRRQSNADLLVVTGEHGHVLGSAGADETAMAAAVALASQPTHTSTFWPHTRGLLQVIAVPIAIGPAETLGRLMLGFFLDDRLAERFKELTGSDIAFGAAGTVLASTVPAPARAALVPLLHATDVGHVSLDGQDFVVERRAMATPGSGDAWTASGHPVVLVLRSRTERLQFLRAIRTGLVGVLVLTLLLATLLSYAVARTMTRPLAAITAGMREVAATGDLTRKVALRSRGWDDEDARLLATTFNTLTESIARFQREATQRERLSALGRLSTVIAHEIRNPLMIIKAALNSLRRSHPRDADAREAIADIDGETARLNRIVTEVLDFARPLRFDVGEASLNAICVGSVVAATADEPEPGVALALDASDPTLLTDAELLRTALVNLLTNARNAVRSRALSGSGVASFPDAPVRLETHQLSRDRVRVSVIDRGVGIPACDLPQIFDPYFTTRRTGTGLGLPIARNIIEGLGGHISVTSDVGTGTRFDVELPLHAPVVAA